MPANARFSSVRGLAVVAAFRMGDVLASITRLVTGVVRAADAVVARRDPGQTPCVNVTSLNSVAKLPIAAQSIRRCVSTLITLAVARVDGTSHSVVTDRGHAAQTAAGNAAGFTACAKPAVIAPSIMRGMNTSVRLIVARVGRTRDPVVAGWWRAGFATTIRACLRAVAEQAIVAIGIAGTEGLVLTDAALCTHAATTFSSLVTPGVRGTLGSTDDCAI
jgi:hypothetical protein